MGVGNAIDKPALDAMASELPNGGRCVLIFDTEEQYYHTLLDAVEMIKGGHGVLLKNLDIYVSKVERVTSRKIKKAKKAARKAAKRAARKAREVVSEDVKKPKKA